MGRDHEAAAPVTRHPAKWTPSILTRANELLWELLPDVDVPTVLDPFAGVGGIHALAPEVNTVGVELEPEWAVQHPRNQMGTALMLDFPNSTFDAIITSPCYGNRMADHHNAKDGSRRNTYKHALEREPSSDNAGTLQWGGKYRVFHERAWSEAARVLVPGGLVILNVKNHIRRGEEQFVAEWHLMYWLSVGARLEHVERLRTPGLRAGANHDVRVDGEMLMVVRLP